LRTSHSPQSHGSAGGGGRAARPAAPDAARRLGPFAVGAASSLSIPRRMASFIAPIDRNVSLRGGGGTRVWTVLTAASTGPLSLGFPDRAGRTATP